MKVLCLVRRGWSDVGRRLGEFAGRPRSDAAAREPMADESEVARREQVRAAAIRAVQDFDELGALIQKTAQRLDVENASVADLCRLMEAACLLEQHAFRLARIANAPLSASMPVQSAGLDQLRDRSNPTTKETR